MAEYYRLVQVDLDGRAADFGVRSISCEPSVVQVVATPNPCSSQLTLRWSDERPVGEVSLVDARGSLVATRAIKGVDATCVFDTEHLVPGVYFIRLDDATTAPLKVIKQ